MAKGRFVRVCVEVDLNQPVVSRVGVQGNWYNIEYEGLHIICAQCGCYGHLLKDCPIKKSATMEEEKGSGDQKQQLEVIEKSAEESVKGAENQGISDMEQIKEITHGEWLNVVRKKRINKVAPEPKIKDTKFQGNKFNVLNYDISHEEMVNDDLHGVPTKSDGRPKQIHGF